MRHLLMFCLLALTSCKTYELTTLNTINGARTAMPAVTKSRVQMISQDTTGLPLTAYAYLDTADCDAGQLSGFVRQAVEKQNVPLPDVVILASGGRQFAGSNSVYLGFGLTSSSASYTTPQRLILHRLSPVTTPFKYNDSLMVTWLDESAMEAGMLEGDTLLSIGGKSLEFPDGGFFSEWQAARLTWKPGQEVEIVAIRPGEGRVSCSVVLGPRTMMPVMQNNIYKPPRRR